MNILKVEFTRQYIEEIGLSAEDCEWSWNQNKSLISTIDDVDKIIEELKEGLE